MARASAPLGSLVLVLLLAGCAAREPAPGAFSFAVMGDTPYSDGEEARFVEMIDRINAEPVAFAVHVGDFKGGQECTDDLYRRRKAQFDRSTHPFIYTPGDNEWTDCRKPFMGSMDPPGRLASLRRIFFADDYSLGRTRIPLETQRACIAPEIPICGCAAHPENRAWTRGPVHFATVNVSGSDNNVGYDRVNDHEARCRNEANRQWLERAVAESSAPGIRALVVITQANPWFVIEKKGVFDAFLAQLRASAARLRKPLLLIHGDTHMYRADRPFVDEAGAPLPFLSRLETWGSPFVGWVRVTVDPGKSDLFTFESNLYAVVPARR